MSAHVMLKALAVLITAALLAGCGQDATAKNPSGAAESEGAGDRLRVVVTTGMVADLVRNVAGDRADVVGLMGPGIDPHLYQPTRSDMAALMSADVVLYNGLMLEGRMTDALERLGAAGEAKVFAVTQLLDHSDLLEPEGARGHPDPHVWMDPPAWANAVTVVRDALIEVDPTGEAQYAANAAAYVDRLAELDEYARRVLATIPERQRVLVTAHDAFNYFGRRYGFEVLGIQGISTQSEAGVRDIERLVDLLVDRNVPAVFVESTVSERNIKALIAGAEAKGHTVRIGGQLFSDAMGEEGTYRGTYLGMIDHNVTTIVRSLGGVAPAGGMQGKLAP